MEKAYDLKALGEMIKAEAKKEGLTIAEEGLEKIGKAVYFGMKEWLKKSAELSDSGLIGKIDDFLAPLIDKLDSQVLPQIEKLDLDGDGQ